jgi:hypothetical protein
MGKINTEITVNSIASKQNSPINILSQEKFSNFLKSDDKEEETTSNETTKEVDIFMQSLQNKAQLNRMIIESVA